MMRGSPRGVLFSSPPAPKRARIASISAYKGIAGQGHDRVCEYLRKLDHIILNGGHTMLWGVYLRARDRTEYVSVWGRGLFYRGGYIKWGSYYAMGCVPAYKGP